jgi:hypothetical protein
LHEFTDDIIGFGFSSFRIAGDLKGSASDISVILNGFIGTVSMSDTVYPIVVVIFILDRRWRFIDSMRV